MDDTLANPIYLDSGQAARRPGRKSSGLVSDTRSAIHRGRSQAAASKWATTATLGRVADTVGMGQTILAHGSNTEIERWPARRYYDLTEKNVAMWGSAIRSPHPLHKD